MEDISNQNEEQVEEIVLKVLAVLNEKSNPFNKGNDSILHANEEGILKKKTLSISKLIDHTLLKPESTAEQITRYAMKP